MSNIPRNDMTHQSVASSPLSQILAQLDQLTQQQATGQLVLSNHAQEAKLHLFYGRLIYATSDFHPIRRWQRSIRKHCPTWNPQPLEHSIDDDKPWEYQSLYLGIVEYKISLSQAKTVIQSVLWEVLFSLSLCPDLTLHWETQLESNSELSLGLALSYVEIQPIFNYVALMQKKWQASDLGNFCPNLSPITKKPLEPESFSGWGKYLNGQYTLWDIAYDQEKSIGAVTRTLMPLMRMGYLRFQTIPDIPASRLTQSAISQQRVAVSQIPSPRKSPLIACIDDSPTVGKALQQILEPAGYHLLYLPEPLQAIAQLAEHKPDVILLDVVMPNVNGYTVCQFLRNTKIFMNTPIIMITSQDNGLERNSSQRVGATDFLMKPINSVQLLQTLKKHLTVSRNTETLNTPLTLATVAS